MGRVAPTQEETLSAKEAELTERESILASSLSSTSMSAETMKLQSDELQNRQAELDSKQSAWETERNQWVESCRTQEKILASREEEITQKTAQLETMKDQFHAEEKQWKHQLAEWERNCERWEAEQTEQDLSIGSFPTGETRAAEDELSHQTEQVEKVQSTPHKSTLLSSANDEEESVDDYMVRLMQRIRSAQGEVVNDTNQPNLPASKRSESVPVPIEIVPPVATSPIHTPAQHGTPADLAPRSTAPEKEVDINVFRDLANYSAQNALGTHARGQMMRRYVFKTGSSLDGRIHRHRTALGLAVLVF